MAGVLSSLAGLGMTKPVREATGIACPAFHACVVRDEMFDLADCSGRDKMVENPVLQQQAQANTKEQFAMGDFPDVVKRATYATLSSHSSMAKQVLSNEGTRDRFGAIILDLVWEKLQEEAALAG